MPFVVNGKAARAALPDAPKVRGPRLDRMASLAAAAREFDPDQDFLVKVDVPLGFPLWIVDRLLDAG
jgi:hypothetical protein